MRDEGENYSKADEPTDCPDGGRRKGKRVLCQEKWQENRYFVADHSGVGNGGSGGWTAAEGGAPGCIKMRLCAVFAGYMHSTFTQSAELHPSTRHLQGCNPVSCGSQDTGLHFCRRSQNRQNQLNHLTFNRIRNPLHFRRICRERKSGANFSKYEGGSCRDFSRHDVSGSTQRCGRRGHAAASS